MWSSLTNLDMASVTGYEVVSPRPGQTQEVTEGFVASTAVKLLQRSNELELFLKAGGVVVIKVQPRSALWATDLYGNRHEVDSTDWLTAAVPAFLYARSGGKPPFVPGSGREIVIRELDHPFESVIRQASGYTGRIAAEVFELADPILVATTRIGDPVAAEIPVGDGLVLPIPSGVDDAVLLDAIGKLLNARERHRQTWLLPKEVALAEEDKAVRGEIRDRLASIATQQKDLADLRASVMKKVDVARVVNYFENGTSVARPIDRAMQDLYKLVELLEDYFGGSEEKLASGLGVPKSLYKHIKKVANQPKRDLRHAVSGETEAADAAEVQQARDDAHTLVQRFIEHCCDEEMKLRAASAAAPNAATAM